MSETNSECLIDREQQIRRLDEAYAECVTGRGGMAIISGPVATGKTTLLDYFVDRAAESGALVLTATATRAEQSLPLRVVDQLLYGNNLPTGTVSHLDSLLTAVAKNSWHSDMLGTDRRQNAQALRILYTALISLAKQAPLVIAIDDVQYADTQSQQCLASYAPRLRASRAMLVLTESSDLTHSDPVAHAELRRNWYDRPIEVAPLTRRAVEQLMARYPHLDSPQVADEAFAVTGGNPLLLRALVEDSVSPQPGDGAGLVVGLRYAEAVRDCLYRAGPAVAEVARGLAVLKDRAGSALLAQLLRLSAEAVDRTVDRLDRAGLLEAGALRHPAARAAVIAGMGPERYAELHSDAAELTYKAGESAAVVSRHLVLADRVEPEWGLQVLLDATEQALAGGDIDHALACLRVSETCCDDKDQRAAILSTLARVKWRVNPANVLSYLPDLMAAVHDGRPDARRPGAVVFDLLWHNQVDPALEMIEALCDTGDRVADPTGSISSAVLWLAYSFPGYAAQARKYWSGLGRHEPAEGVGTPALLAAAAMEVVLKRPTDDAVATAKQALHHIQLSDDTIVPAVVALSTLLIADRTEAAGFWCDSLLKGATARQAPTWQAMLLAIRAEIAVMRGELQIAENNALTALAKISPEGWGPAVGGVLATLILAATETGRYEDAAEFLDVPVPADMLRTPFGLKYTHARGTYHLATGRIEDALIDFQLCGDTMARYGLDQPGLVPWRTSLAQAHLAAENVDQAHDLASDQLRLLDDSQKRMRGITIRILACARAAKTRPALLRQAIELLKESGDWLEVARAYTDLSDALNKNGEPNRARLTLRTARTIAKQCQAHALLRRLGPGSEPAAETPTFIQSTTAELSEAERRVASLAALGHTNREIASSLWVTVSTVEQHLTRIYRKMGIIKRTDLPSGLNA